MLGFRAILGTGLWFDSIWTWIIVVGCGRRYGTSAGYAADPDGAKKGDDLMAPPESAALNARGRRVPANVRRHWHRFLEQNPADGGKGK